MKAKWNEMTVMERIMFVSQMIILVIVLILGLFQFLGIVENTRSILVPLVGIDLSISAFQVWNRDRDSASIYIILGIIAFIITLSIWFEK